MPTNPPDYGFNLNFSLADAALYPPSNSLFTERFNIPSIESDILLWDQTWEQILPTLSPEQDVYSTLKPYVLQFQGGFVHLMQRLRRLRSNVSQVQLVVTALWEGMADNRRPLLSCLRVNTHPWANEWWDGIINLPHPWPAQDKLIHLILTVQRNEFVAGFLLHATMSFAEGRGHGHTHLDRTVEFPNTNIEAKLNEKRKASLANQTPSHCENCTISAPELAPGCQFMMCSRCKSKLDFVIYYCSKSCQKDDWNFHKQYCGKEKHRKTVPQDNIPRSLLPTTNRRYEHINTSGFGSLNGPPTRRRSAALEKQISLLKADKDTDYFIFDDQESPVRFEVSGHWLKTVFRTVRGEVFDHVKLSGPGPEVLAQYLIKAAESTPGISRQRILAQFNREYGPHTASDVAALDRLTLGGSTRLEMMSQKAPDLISKQLLGMNGWIQ